MLEKLFREFLKLSGSLRPEYPNSLGMFDSSYQTKIHAFWKGEIPRLIEVIYSLVVGTRRNIREQRLMDFLPGYRLIHLDELAEVCADLSQQVIGFTLFPFLSNYSSDYICLENEKVCNFMHDEAEITVMHNSSEAFLKTICEFYHRNIYFLDEDNYLDYNVEAERECGAELNPGIGYWLE